MQQQSSSPRQRGVQSIDTAARLMRILAEADEPMMLRDIAARAGIKSAQAHAYLISLRKHGMVQQLGTAGRYTLAEETLRLAHAALAEMPGHDALKRAADRLSAETGLTVAIDLWIRGAATAVFVAEGHLLQAFSLHAGTRSDRSNSASAWLFAAWGCGPPAGPAAATQAAAMRAEGLARCEGLPLPHLSTLAVPVLAADGLLAAALSLIGPAAQIAASRAPLADALLAAAETAHG
ncbi:helix-turn-helix domain-containing protein [Mangrovicoccus sp. HB161399]|uniref:helix-turn-helix domain-containing protein n=1 Tax=Mangrovicoccus sp. HB161399 TaxID=2720392 RepID=UPI00155422CD|nr:helix-turn-helix domain-containing protein [Mangrovicoccus sp. HB161399]